MHAELNMNPRTRKHLEIVPINVGLVLQEVVEYLKATGILEISETHLE